jgi:hypothetical protein
VIEASDGRVLLLSESPERQRAAGGLQRGVVVTLEGRGPGEERTARQIAV